MSVKVQVASSLLFISVKSCHRRTTNALAISRALVSANIKRVSYTITAFLGHELTKLRTTENSVK